MAGELGTFGSKRFRIVRRLGSGGMGVVYEAVDEDGARVALKTLKNAEPQALYRFKREFRSLADIGHPNLVRLGELHCEQDQWYFTMELLEGEPFTEWVTADGPARHIETVPVGDAPPVASRRRGAHRFDEARLRAAIPQLVAGVMALHDAVLVHRDIKPSNVLVGHDGRLVVLDFGLVAEAAMVESSKAFSDANVVGTVAYMAPEQAAGMPAGPAADWYSVGVMIYEALTGRLPFEGQALEVLMAKQRQDPPPPSAVVHGIPADLDDLAVALLRFDPSERPDGARMLARFGGATHRSSLSPSADSTSAGSSAPFVGREQERELLQQAFDDVTEGHRVAVFVRGESGIGKSLLVRRVLRDIQGEALVLSGRCYEREVVPYKAFDGIIDELSRYLKRLDDVDAALLVPRDVARLARIFPVLDRVPAVARAPSGKGGDDTVDDLRSQAFATLAELLANLAERQPIILYVDDLQWADADSFILLEELLSSEDAPSLLLVAAVRTETNDDEVRTEGGPSWSWLLAPTAESAQTKRRENFSGALRNVDVRVVDLGRLSDPEASELTARLLSLSTREGDLDTAALLAEADGHPLFISELVQRQGDAAGLVHLDDAIWARVQTLEDAAIELLVALAVAGVPTDRDVVVEVADLDAPTAARALGVLRVAHLLKGSATGDGRRIECYHDRVREAVVAKLGDEERRDTHRRLVEVLEARGYGEREPRTLVRHLIGAGERERASRHAERAAELAAKSLAFDQAAELNLLAKRLAGDERRRELELRTAEALRDAGRGAESAEAFLGAAEGADAATRLICRREAALQLLQAGRVGEGLTAIEVVLEEIGERIAASPLRALVSLLWRRFRLWLRGLKFETRDLTEVTPKALERIDLYRVIATFFAFVDNIRGADFQTRGLLVALDTGEPSRLGRALVFEAIFQAAQGRKTKKRCDELVAYAQQIDGATGDPWVRITLMALVAFRHFFAGEFAESNEQFRVAEDSYLENPFQGERFELFTFRLFRLISLRHIGTYPEMVRAVDEQLRDARRRSDRYTETSITRALNLRWLVTGDLDEARGVLDREAWTIPGGAYHVQHWYKLMADIELALYQGRCADIRGDHAQSFAGYRRSLLVRLVSIRTLHCWLEARLDLATAATSPNTGPLLRHAEKMAKKLEREGLASTLAWASLIRATVAHLRGDEAAAVARLHRAISGLESARLMGYAAAARRAQGLVMGGDTGAALVDGADAWFRDRGVVDPARFARIYAPGFLPFDEPY